jgi:fatty acid amide hydrolase
MPPDLSAPAAAEITAWSATEIARRVAAGEVSAAEVVEAHVGRIEAVNPRLNALVANRFAAARAEARAADEARQRGEPLGPLHGVPVTVKDMFDVAGLPTTLGLPHWAGRVAAEDAATVARLRRAGAILLGKTNVPQLGMACEADNPLHGRTLNPWDEGRTPGGSSGGEAALIAAGGSPLGLGSDGGGSVRQPCHSCGTHGFMPTPGRLTLRGHAPYPPWVMDLVQPGPLARSAADVALALRVLGASDRDAPSVALPDPAAVAVENLRVGFYTDDGYFPASPALRRAVTEAAGALRAAGAEVVEFRPPDVAEAVHLYWGRLFADGLAYMRRWLGRGEKAWHVRALLQGAGVPTPLRRLSAWLLGRAGRRMEAEFLRAVPRRAISLAEFGRLVERQQAYRRRFLAALDEARLDALVCPPCGLPAVTHRCQYAGLATSYTLLFNVVGMPAGVVAATRVRPGEERDRPAGDRVSQEARVVEAGSAGLPVGVQVAARPWREDVALAVLAALEEHFRARPDYPARPPLGKEYP